MRSFVRYSYLKQITSCCVYCNKSSKVFLRQYASGLVLPDRRKLFTSPGKFSFITCVYSSDEKKHYLNFDKKSESLKDALVYKKQQLRNTEHRIRQRGEDFVKDIKHQKVITEEKWRVKKEHIIKDIRETKAKMKERLGEVVEKENAFTIPNILCVTRIVVSPYVGYLVLQEDYSLALGLLIFAGITDLLDGWIARNWKGQSSKMGSFLDPLADKVLIATMFISLTWQDLIPLPLTLLIVGRDVALVASGFVIRYMSLPPPRTLSRYFDVTHATAQLAPTFISKVNTSIQLLLVGTTLASPVFDYVDHPALQTLCWLTAVSTVVSAISYIVSKDTYKILRRKS